MSQDDQEKDLDVLEHVEAGGIESLPERVERYGKAKSGALDVVQYMAGLRRSQALDKLISRVQSCGDYLVFRHFLTINEVKLHSAHLCSKHLLCPLCAIRRGAKFLSAYMQRLETIMFDRPELRPYLITLTVRDGPDLAERFAHLHVSQRELWKRKQRGRGSAFDGIVGAVWSYEAKRGSGSGLWHPHLHILALAESRPSEPRLSREWHEITRDSFIVDVRPINPDDPVPGFLEVFKYAVKFSSQAPADTFHAFQVLRGKRLLASSGVFRGVPEPEGLLDDSQALADLPYVDLFYRFFGSGYTLSSE